MRAQHWIATCLVLLGGPSLAQERAPKSDVAPVTSPTTPADDDINLYLWPIFESIKQGDRSELTLLGFYKSVSSPDHRELRIAPFYSYEWDKAEDRTEWDVLWPLISHERRGEATKTAVRPFFWSADDPTTGRGYNHLFPLWYSEWDEDTSTTVGLPGWVYARRGDRRMLHAWPFFGRHDLEAGGTRWFSLAHGVWWDTGRAAGTGSFGALPFLTYADWSPQSAVAFSVPLLFGRGRMGDESWWASIPFAAGRHTPTLDQVVTIPYAYTRDETSTRHDVLFPFITKEDRHDGTRSELSVRPLFWYDSTPERTWTLAPPLFHTYASKDLNLVWTIPYSYTRDAKSTRHDVLFPFITKRDRHDGARSELSVRPLFWYDSTPERTYRVSPLFYSRTSETDSRFWSLPYLYNRDAESTRHDVLFPLFTKKDAHDGSRSELSVRPLFWSDRTRERAWTLAPPLFHTYASEDLTRVWTIPYSYTRDQTSTRHDVLFPFFTKQDRHDGARSELSVRPLFWYDSTPERTYRISPLFYSRTSETESRFWSLPYLYNRDAESTRHDVLFPLFTKEDAHDGSRSALSVRPLFWSDRTRERAWTLAPPLFHTYASEDLTRVWTIPYSYTRDAKSTRHDVLFPFITKQDRHDGTRSELSVRPLFWYDSTPERTYRVSPLFYNRTSEAESRFWSLPYLYNRDAESTRHDVLFPLFTKEDAADGSHSALSVRPLFWSDRTRERAWTLAPPLFHTYASEDLTRVWTIPYAYTRDAKSTRHDVLFPFFTKQDSHDGSRSELSVRPLFWYDSTPERTYAVSPLFYGYSDAEKGRFWSLPYLYNRNAERSRHDVLFPLFTARFEPEDARTEVSVRPFFWYDRTPERTWTIAPPFFLKYSSKDEELLWTIPYGYTRKGDDVRHDFLWPFVSGRATEDGSQAHFYARPFFWYDRTPERTYMVAPPFFYSYADQDVARLWSLPYLYNRDAEGSRHDVLWPLFTAKFAADDSRTEVSLRPLFWYDRNPERSWSLAFPFFHTYDSDERSRVWTIPYAYTRDQETTRHDVLFPLFTHESSHDGKRSSTAFRPLFWFDQTPERTYMVAPPLFYSYADEHVARLWSLPYLYNRDAEGSRHDVLFPLFTAKFAADDSSTEVSFRPLFWYDRDPERTWSFAFPLFHSYESEDLSRLWTIPYAYTRDRETTRHDVLFPLFTHEASHDGTRSSTAFRPLLWHDESPEESSTLALPLFYRYASESVSRFWSIPYLYNRDAEGSRHDVLFPLFTAKESADGERSEVSFRPLFWYDRSPEATWSLFFPLFHTYDSDDLDLVWTIPYSYTRKGDTTRHDVLFPLFTAKSSDDGERSEVSFRPLFWYDDSPERTYTLALPIFWSYFSERFSNIVTPLYMQKIDRERGTTQRLVPPLYFEWSEGERTSRLILPFYWDVGSSEESRSVQLWPFFGWSQDGDYEEYSTLWPLVAWGSGGGRGHSRFLPLWWYGREKDDWHLEVLFPLVHAEGTGEETSWSALHSLLRYRAKGEDYDFRVLWWLYRLRQEGDRYDNMFLPLFWHSAEGQESNLWVLYPLFEYENGPKGGELDVGWKAFTYSWGEDKAEWRFLYKFLYYKRDGDAGIVQFNPFFSYEWDGEDTATFQLFGGAYYRAKRKGEWRSGGLWGVF